MIRRLLSLLRRNRQLLGSWATFVGLLALMIAASEWRSQWVDEALSAWTARTTGWALSALGQPARVSGVIVSCPRCSFEVIGECTAFFPSAILVAAILASPARARSKLAGLGLGIPTLYLINVVRLVSLCFLLQVYPRAFEMLHLLVWQSLLIFVTLLLYLLWFAMADRRLGPRGEDAPGTR